MKLKLFLVLLISIVAGSQIKAQLSINENGMVTIVANTQDWWNALKVYVPTYNSGAFALNYAGKDRFWVHASGYLWCERGGYFGSDSILKENIKKIDSPLKKLKKINGYEYNYKNSYTKDQSDDLIESYEKEHRIGLIAQEVEKVFPYVVKTMPDSTKAISYTDFIAILVESINEQQSQIEMLVGMILSQEQEITNIKKMAEEIQVDKKHNGNLKLNDSKEQDNDSKLFDCIPNPFSASTEIGYIIPEKSNSRLIIHDMHGVEMKSIKLNQGGLSSIIVNNLELKTGMYLYSLVVEGKIIDTKRMLLIKD